MAPHLEGSECLVARAAGRRQAVLCDPERCVTSDHEERDPLEQLAREADHEWQDFTPIGGIGEKLCYRLELVRGRGKWFETPDRSPLAIWWLPAGTIPTVEDGRAKLEHLWKHGPTPD